MSENDVIKAINDLNNFKSASLRGEKMINWLIQAKPEEINEQIKLEIIDVMQSILFLMPVIVNNVQKGLTHFEFNNSNND